MTSIFKNRFILLLTIMMLYQVIISCEKEAPSIVDKGQLTIEQVRVSVTARTETGALLQWATPAGFGNGDKIRYEIYIGDNEVASGIKGNSFQLTQLTASASSGRVVATMVIGNSFRAVPLPMHFLIPPFLPVNPYYYVNGFYKVTETCTNLNNGAISNYMFVSRVSAINDSTIRFIQNQRIPKTWWTTNFDVQAYPYLGDSLMGIGTTPRGRILNQDSIRMSYLFGTTVVYEVRQIWQKFANPADTATVTYSYPSFPGMINTVAGNNTSGSGSGTSGDGGPALAASLLNFADVICDNSGNIYFTDGSSTNYSIRKVDVNGIINRFAGNNTAGFSGDGGPAASAQLNYPQGLAIDNAGNLLIADAVNRVIRKVDAGGIISTIAGIPGSYGYSGDGGLATAAQLGSPAGMCVDAAGNIYFADPGRHVVRRIDVNGIISTVAGIGGPSGSFSGDGGPATAARLNSPNDVCIDPAGNLYIADKGNHVIRMVDGNGIITTVAGIGGFLNSGSTGDGGLATLAKLNNPQSVTMDAAGNLYISDNTNNKIRMVNTVGIINTVAGSGQAAQLGDGPDFWGGDYGPATDAAISSPKGIFWSNNKLYIATSYRIRKITF